MARSFYKGEVDQPLAAAGLDPNVIQTAPTNTETNCPRRPVQACRRVATINVVFAREGRQSAAPAMTETFS